MAGNLFQYAGDLAGNLFDRTIFGQVANERKLLDAINKRNAARAAVAAQIRPGGLAPDQMAVGPQLGPDGQIINMPDASSGASGQQSGIAGLDQLHALLAQGAILKNGDYSGAAAIIKQPDPQIAIDSAGNPYNQHDINSLNRPRAQSLQPVNGFLADMNDPSNVNRYLPKLMDNATPLYDQKGNVVAQRLLDGTVQALEASAGATARGTEGARAALDIIQVPQADGTFKAMPRSQAAAALGAPPGIQSGPPRVGAPGVPGAGGFGVSQSPGEAAAAKGMGEQAATLLGSASTMRSEAQASANNAQQALNYALTINPNAYTPAIATIAKYLPGDQARNFTGDVRSYSMLINTELKDYARTFPGQQSDRELKTVQAMVPQLDSPKQAAAVYFAGRAAANHRKLAYADFLTSYEGPKDPQAIQRAWMQTPDGKRSLFEDPVWQSFTLGGKPVVSYYDYKGRRYGVTHFGARDPGTVFPATQ